MAGAEQAWQLYRQTKDRDRYTAALLRLSAIHVELKKIREELKTDGHVAKARVLIVQAAHKVEAAAADLQNRF